MSTKKVENFYDNFTSRFIKDYVYGNWRIKAQMEFFKNSIPKNASNILIIGCGSGQTARYIAKQCSNSTKILAVDISSKALNIANCLFKHSQVEYKKTNILTNNIGGKWDVIVLPDVYEHIPLCKRDLLHSKIRSLGETTKGRILLTVPSPYRQEFLRREYPDGLQIVDEVVDLKSLIKFADEVKGVLTYYNIISVWRVSDYIHVIIEREVHLGKKISTRFITPNKTKRPKNFLTRCLVYVLHKIRLTRITKYIRHIRVKRCLRENHSYHK